MFPTPINKTAPWMQSTYKVLLPIALVIWLLPLIGIAMTSIRPSSDLASGNYFGWPSGFDFVKNYSAVFQNSNIGWYIINSFYVTIPTVIGAVALSCLSGYALAVYKFKANLWVFFMFVAGNFVPFQILAIPVRDLTVKLGMYNSMWGLILFHVAFQTGFCTLFMRNFIKALPFALIESARVEGVSEWKIFSRIVLPLMRPAIAALSVLIFTFIWNDYFWATIMATDASVRPVTAGMNELKGQWKVAWELIAAASIIAALPPVAMFFLMQKHFIAGLTLGATKG
jgi:multiple sugar transport system permease protein